ncbi:heme lyase CcmF/NrfE family subunit [uncultured Pseudoteredinibacter sp.]|uniref:heme lyase CcmF/NrfE family subunit n=1 Tax=uncultured Pseudoteredinibacter sp. TaxID=1641701 RepID=UPI002603260A|nr:heme lyase CcmF/NrfE family subunit [uncultured Pseudoteredinibacter sp.]
MIAELGHIALIVALGLSFLLAAIPMIGSYSNNLLWMRSSRSLATGVFVFIALAYACLTISFMESDFSVAYVAATSNSMLPWYYKASAVWGGHEGSFLLWVLMLTGWTFTVACLSRSLPMAMVARVLSVLGFLTIGFLLFMLLTSNPFDRLLPDTPSEGRDLNPLLQDPAFVFHPPILYMGYVGLSVNFAFAIAALLSGRLDSAWARWSRPWATAAWAFLTLGIALGSWWAYYELGWGGWWFWDPVENASFMPWLVSTALVHSLAVTEKRGVFKSWTILLAIFAFSLSLLGTFLVRSGVITSVHAFATDPERGVFILGFLALVVGGSLTIYALKAPTMRAVATFGWMSREMFLLLNNMLLIVIMLTVLLGTLYPLIADAMGLGRISVGPPFFNAFFVPLVLVLSVLLGFGSVSQWKKTKGQKLASFLWVPAAAAVLMGLAVALMYGDGFHWQGWLCAAIGFWVIAVSLRDWWSKASKKRGSTFSQLFNMNASFYAMMLAHIGLGMTVVGGGLSSIYSVQSDVRLVPGDKVSVGAYEFNFSGTEGVRGPNYIADRANVTVLKDGKQIAELGPEKRRYFSGGNMMTEAAVDSSFGRDLYMAMGEHLGEGAWAVRVYVKPFIMWIWIGCLLMGFGGFVAVADKRYRRLSAVQSEMPATSTTA